MDVQRPIPNQEITAGWGAAVSDALRAQGLMGPGAVRAPGGTSLPPPPMAGPSRADPPTARFAAWVARGETNEGYRVRVRKGALRDAAGNGLTLSATDLTDKGDWWEVEVPAGGGEIAAEDDGDGGWTLTIGNSSGSSQTAGAWRIPIAAVSVRTGKPPVITQYRIGDQTVPGAAAESSVAPGEATVYRTLDSTAEPYAHTDTWTYGDTEYDQSAQKAVPCGVQFVQNRTYYDRGDSNIYEYPRAVRYNAAGLLAYVGPEVKRAVAPVEPEGD